MNEELIATIMKDIKNEIGWVENERLKGLSNHILFMIESILKRHLMKGETP